MHGVRVTALNGIALVYAAAMVVALLYVGAWAVVMLSDAFALLFTWVAGWRAKRGRSLPRAVLLRRRRRQRTKLRRRAIEHWRAKQRSRGSIRRSATGA